MVWVRDNATGGFTTGKPWLPVPPEHLARAAAVEDAETKSLLHDYRRALALRHAHPALIDGAQSDMAAEGDVLTFRRSGGGEVIWVAVNLSGKAAKVVAPAGRWTNVARDLGGADPKEERIALDAWGVAVLKKQD